MMPTFISIVDHMPTGMLSQVGFFELAKWTRDCRRTMEMTVKLRWLVGVIKEGKKGLTKFRP